MNETHTKRPYLEISDVIDIDADDAEEPLAPDRPDQQPKSVCSALLNLFESF
jgi:hypothetical protein